MLLTRSRISVHTLFVSQYCIVGVVSVQMQQFAKPNLEQRHLKMHIKTGELLTWAITIPCRLGLQLLPVSSS